MSGGVFEYFDHGRLKTMLNHVRHMLPHSTFSLLLESVSIEAGNKGTWRSFLASDEITRSHDYRQLFADAGYRIDYTQKDDIQEPNRHTAVSLFASQDSTSIQQ